MRSEKKYLVEETSDHLNKSDFVYLVDYARMSVPDFSEMRKALRQEAAEFHVVKNSILLIAAKEKSMPELGELEGQTAIVVGGNNPSGVAKALFKFAKDKDGKCAVKIGVLGDKLMSAAEVEELSKLPSIEVIKAQFLSLLNTPASQLVRVLNGVPQAVLNVLDAKAKL